MNAVACPSKEILRSFLNGKLPEDDSAVLEAHLSDCSSCEEVATKIEKEPDTLAEYLQASGESGVEDPGSANVESFAAAKQLATCASELAWSESPSLPSQVAGSVGSYDLIDQLGRGGMGAVYLARHRELDKEVAIKLLPNLSAKREAVVARFRREIRAAGKLEHPSIVRATDAGESGGTHFLVMEVVRGLDLSRIARCLQPLSIADACEIVRQAALGIAYAHAQGIIHRDIKPSNLMLDEHGRVKILDFGLAQLLHGDAESAELTTEGQLMGTLDYMAPEQGTRGSAIDVRVDVYSLGATLFRLLSGKPPLDCEADLSPLAKLRVLAEHKKRSIRDLRADVPSHLVQLLERMLATEPTRRPSSAEEVASALEAYCRSADLMVLISKALEADRRLDAQAVQPAPPTPPAIASGTRRPNNWIAWTAMVLVPILAAAGILITLELTKGQLVIDSEDVEVTLNIVDENERVQELQIEPGPNSTRLRDGRYEIIISEGSDRFSLSENTFTIHRGEVQVARVMKVDTDPSRPNTGKDSPNPLARKPESSGDPFGGAQPAAANPFVSDLENSQDPFGQNLRGANPGNPGAAVAGSTLTEASERRIYAALGQQVECEFNAMPLQQVLLTLAEDLRIPIWISQADLEDLGRSADEPITLSLPPVSLRSALRLMLDPLDLDYVVRNEVLEITTLEVAREYHVNPGDTLAIYVEHTIPLTTDVRKPAAIPIFQAGNRPPVQGLPFPVDEHGRIRLPMIGAQQVSHRSLSEISRAIQQAYVDTGVFKAAPAMSVQFLMRADEPMEVKNLTAPAEFNPFEN